MKKLVFLLTLVMLAMCVFCVCPSADELTTEEESAVQEEFDPSTEESESLLDNLTNASFWVTIGTDLLAVIGVLYTVKKNIDNIKGLVGKKADNDTIMSALKSAKEEISLAYMNKLADVTKALDAEKDENKKLSAILGIAFANMKGIPESAKAEIVALLNDIHTVSGTVTEIVEKAQEAIDQAEATAEKVETPALDALKENYIAME